MHKVFQHTGDSVVVVANSPPSLAVLPTLPASGSYRLTSDVDVYYRFGDNTVVADNDGDSAFQPAKTIEYVRVPIGATHISVLSASNIGRVTVTPGLLD